jgi:hypothetical protein
MIHYGVLPYLETLHLSYTSDPEETFDHVKWIARFTKDSCYLALGGTVNTLIMYAMKCLERETNEGIACKCLKALSYLYMNGNCDDDMFKPQFIALIAKHAKKALDDKSVIFRC